MLQLGEDEKAKQLIERSIQLNPQQDGQKYCNLAEMNKGQDAVQLYREGIRVLESDATRHADSHSEAMSALAVRQRASAMASIAELYMTAPLCDEANAEQTCEECLATALQVDADNLDALQCLANLRLLRDKDDEAKELIKKVVKNIVQIREKQEAEGTLGNLLKAKKTNQNVNMGEMPSLEFRMQTSR